LNRNIIFTVGFAFATILYSCNNAGKPSPTDTPTAGDIKIAADESFKPIIDTELYTFQSLYTKAHVSCTYTSEAECVKALTSDSVRLIVMSRQLSATESAYFDNIKIKPRITKICIDAVALIVNLGNTDTLMDVESLKKILSGEIKDWSGLNNKSKTGAINVVFDNPSSGNARFLKDSLLQGKAFGNNCFAQKSNADVIDYVNKNKNALGIISVAWISDKDDPSVMSFLSKVKVVSVASKSSTDTEDYLLPYQAYIAQNTYPLCRSVYSISREARAGLGTGFVSFIAGDKGQRIILKSGLVPSTMPVRLIEMN
jgi:phosphate transport system substrate-binding protein